MRLQLYNKNPWQMIYDARKNLENFWDLPIDNKEDSFPVCNFYEDKNHYFISFDLPGMQKEDIKINYENRTLTISGRREEEYKEETSEGVSHFIERFQGSFNRSFNLPLEIDEEKITAHFTNGVLELLLPKSTKSKGREISIQEGKKGFKLFSKPLSKKSQEA